MDNEENPRATMVMNNTQDEERIQQIITNIQESENKNVFFILSKFIEFPQIKTEPDFIESLFTQNLAIIVQMIDWMLIPKFIIRQRKIKSNVDGYPFHSKQFIKDNWCFYQQFYIYARNGVLSFDTWLKFLDKKYFDPSTIHTAMGYFAEVMIPFAKYQFSGSFNLTHSLGTNLQHSETFGIMKIIGDQVLQEIIKNCQYSPVYQFLTTAILVSIDDPNDTHASQRALFKLFHSATKKFRFEEILPQVQRHKINQNCQLLENICITLKEAIGNIDPDKNLCPRSQALIKAILESELIEYASETIIQSRFCGVAQKLSNSVKVDHDSPHCAEQMMSSMPISPQKHIPRPYICEQEEYLLEILIKILTYTVEIFIKTPKKLQSDYKELLINSPPCKRQPDYIEKDSESLQQMSRKQSLEFTEESFDNQQSLQKSRKTQKVQQYHTLMINFRQKMQQLLSLLPKMNLLVYRPPNMPGKNIFSSKTINFSSGQNIKPITFMKYQYFKLLHSCLIMVHCRSIENQNYYERKSEGNLTQPQFHLQFYEEEPQIIDELLQSERFVEKDAKRAKKQIQDQQKSGENQMNKFDIKFSDKLRNKSHRASQKKHHRIISVTFQPFQFEIQKLHLIQIIQKYLNENRWNNIAHRILQKIFHLLVMRQHEFLRKKITKQKQKQKRQNLISYLIQNFTQRDYIFLDTFKFTTQGNLHSLYNISKDLAYTLNSSNQLVLLLNQFEPWKKFLMNDLKKYEEKTYPDGTLPENWEEFKQQEHRSSYDIKVDEVDSIRKLIQNISVNQKWPQRRKSKNKGSSKSVIFRKSDDEKSKQKAVEYMYNSHGQRKSQISEQKQKKTLDDFLKKKIQFSNDGDMNSEIREFEVQQISVRARLANMHKSQIIERKADLGSEKCISEII